MVDRPRFYSTHLIGTDFLCMITSTFALAAEPGQFGRGCSEDLINIRICRYAGGGDRDV
jgi:hypothetical protein